MRKFLPIVLITIIYIVQPVRLSAQTNPLSSSESTNDSTVKVYLNNFNSAHIGYYGSTQNCEPYNVYAFKYKRNWFLFVSSGENLSFMHINPPIKDKSINYTSSYFEEGIAKSHSVGYTRLVKKKRDVVDMDIYGYYKFNRYGRKVIKGLLYLEYPFYNKGFFKWKIDEEKAKEIAAKKLEKELEPLKIETIKTKLNENIPIEKK
jgi:hypothetical protein